MTLAEWFAGAFLSVFEDVRSVTVQKVDPDTGAVVTSSTGVTGYRKGGSGQMALAEGPLARTCQWRLLASGLSFEPEKNHLIVDGSDTWQVESVTSEVFGTYRVCQCARVT